MRLKKIIRWIHLWLGLISGIVVFIVCLSGAFIAFTEEALNIANKNYLYVPKQNKPKASIETVIANYKNKYPQEGMFLVNAYRQENRSYDFFSAVKTGKKDKEGNDEFAGFKMVYADPYTAEILKVDKGTLETIIILIQLHTRLFLGEPGAYIIQYATLIFLIQLIGGIYLWWPKTKNATKTVFKIKTKGSKKRLNYDLHRTLGFYASIALLALVLTGLIMAWDFVQEPLVDSLGGKSELLEKFPPQPARVYNTADYSYNRILDTLLRERPTANQFTFFIPQSDTITVLNGKTNEDITFLNFEVGQYFQFNRYTGEKTGGTSTEAYEQNDKIMAGILFIHMGFWGGLTTKILTFLAGIIGASLPITGFLIWRGRNRKHKQKRVNAAIENYNA